MHGIGLIRSGKEIHNRYLGVQTPALYFTSQGDPISLMALAVGRFSELEKDPIVLSAQRPDLQLNSKLIIIM